MSLEDVDADADVDDESEFVRSCFSSSKSVKCISSKFRSDRDCDEVDEVE